MLIQNLLAVAEIESQFVEDERLTSDREAFWVFNPVGPFFLKQVSYERKSSFDIFVYFVVPSAMHTLF